MTVPLQNWSMRWGGPLGVGDWSVFDGSHYRSGRSPGPFFSCLFGSLRFGVGDCRWSDLGWRVEETTDDVSFQDCLLEGRWKAGRDLRFERILQRAQEHRQLSPFVRQVRLEHSIPEALGEVEKSFFVSPLHILKLEVTLRGVDFPITLEEKMLEHVPVVDQGRPRSAVVGSLLGEEPMLSGAAQVGDYRLK